MILDSHLRTRNLKFDITGRFYGSLAYRYLDDLLSFLVIKSFLGEFNIDQFKAAISSYGLTSDTGAMNSVKEYVKGVLSKVEENKLLEDSDKSRLFPIFYSIFECLGDSLLEAEKVLPIPVGSLNSFRESVVRRYKEKSIVYRIKSDIQEKEKISGLSFIIKVGRNELIFRKYFIPNYFVPLYGLSENVGQDLIDQEIIQFEIKVIYELKVPILRTLFRSIVDSEIGKISYPSFILFKNSFPDYWLRGTTSGRNPISVLDRVDSIHSVFRYNTFDSNPELIIIPKRSISIESGSTIESGRLEQIEENIYWKFLDLSTDGDSRTEVLENPPVFLRANSQLDEELKKYLWLRVAVSNSITIDSEKVLRFKLDPYGE